MKTKRSNYRASERNGILAWCRAVDIVNTRQAAANPSTDCLNFYAAADALVATIRDAIERDVRFTMWAGTQEPLWDFITSDDDYAVTE